jgi:AraC family transcriptional regulator
MVGMPRRIDNPLTYRALYASPLVHVRAYCCRADRGGPAAEEYSASSTIVLMRHGAFCHHLGRRSVTADVNQAVFFGQESTYRISHPADCGDRGTVFVPAPHLLHDMLRELQPAQADHARLLFPFVTGPCSTAVFWRHHEFVQRLEAGPAEQVDALWVEETALELMADVLQAALARHGLDRPRRRRGTDAAHAERTEAIKSYLASRLGQRIMLDDVARLVHTSPFHLARVFRERTGVPVHRYLTRLRLRTALERLADGADDLTLLALDLGFSSHSHFADTFRREFGRTPSQVRSRHRSTALRQMSKNLKV